MKNYKTISLLALLTLGFASCTNFFEREPFSQVGADTFFRSEKDVVLYVNGLLQKNMPGYTTLTYGDQYSDLMAVNSTSDFLKTGVERRETDRLGDQRLGQYLQRQLFPFASLRGGFRRG